jgi:hypothetical protein
MTTPDRLTEDLTRVMQQTMAAPIQELNQSIQALARSVEQLQRDRSAPAESEFDVAFGNDMPHVEEPEETVPDTSMLGLRWFANWRQGASMKGAL